MEQKEYIDSLLALINMVTDTSGLARPPSSSLTQGMAQAREGGSAMDYIRQRAKWLALKHNTGAAHVIVPICSYPTHLDRQAAPAFRSSAPRPQSAQVQGALRGAQLSAVLLHPAYPLHIYTDVYC